MNRQLHYRLRFKPTELIAEQLNGSFVVSSKTYTYNHNQNKDEAISAAIQDHVSFIRDNDLGTM